MRPSLPSAGTGQQKGWVSSSLLSLRCSPQSPERPPVTIPPTGCHLTGREVHGGSEMAGGRDGEKACPPPGAGGRHLALSPRRQRPPPTKISTEATPPVFPPPTESDSPLLLQVRYRPHHGGVLPDPARRGQITVTSPRGRATPGHASSHKSNASARLAGPASPRGRAAGVARPPGGCY